MSFYLFILFFLPDTNVLKFVQYFVCCITHSFQLWKNRWHSIEQRTINASTDHWHSRLKTCICVEGGHFKHMTGINMCKKKNKELTFFMNIYRN